MFQSFLNDRRESALVCVHAGTSQVVGFVCGSQDRSGYLKRALYRYLPRAMPLLIMASLRRPTIAKGLLRRSTMLKRIFNRPRADMAAWPAASLMSIAVDPAYRGRGLGERLVRDYMDLMRKQGVPAIKLGVLNSNRAARNLYERLGWSSVTPALSNVGTTSDYYVFYFDRPAVSP